MLSRRKRWKPLPASPLSTASSPQLTVSLPRFLPAIPCTSSSPATRMTLSPKPSKKPPTASIASASLFCASLPGRNSPLSRAPSKKLCPIFRSINPSPWSVLVELAFPPPAIPRNLRLFSRTAQPGLQRETDLTKLHLNKISLPFNLRSFDLTYCQISRNSRMAAGSVEFHHRERSLGDLAFSQNQAGGPRCSATPWPRGDFFGYSPPLFARAKDSRNGLPRLE